VHNVTWDLSSAPAHITNKHFEIFLCREVGGQVEWMPRKPSLGALPVRIH
jgi:hypothetical protein